MSSRNLLPKQLSVICQTDVSGHEIDTSSPSQSTYYKLDINYNQGREAVELELFQQDRAGTAPATHLSSVTTVQTKNNSNNDSTHNTDLQDMIQSEQPTCLSQDNQTKPPPIQNHVKEKHRVSKRESSNHLNSRHVAVEKATVEKDNKVDTGTQYHHQNYVRRHTKRSRSRHHSKIKVETPEILVAKKDSRQRSREHRSKNRKQFDNCPKRRVTESNANFICDQSKHSHISCAVTKRDYTLVNATTLHKISKDSIVKLKCNSFKHKMRRKYKKLHTPSMETKYKDGKSPSSSSAEIIDPKNHQSTQISITPVGSKKVINYLFSKSKLPSNNNTITEQLKTVTDLVKHKHSSRAKIIKATDNEDLNVKVSKHSKSRRKHDEHTNRNRNASHSVDSKQLNKSNKDCFETQEAAGDTVTKIKNTSQHHNIAENNEIVKPNTSKTKSTIKLENKNEIMRRIKQKETASCTKEQTQKEHKHKSIKKKLLEAQKVDIMNNASNKSHPIEVKNNARLSLQPVVAAVSTMTAKFKEKRSRKSSKKKSSQVLVENPIDCNHDNKITFKEDVKDDLPSPIKETSKHRSRTRKKSKVAAQEVEDLAKKDPVSTEVLVIEDSESNHQEIEPRKEHNRHRGSKEHSDKTAKRKSRKSRMEGYKRTSKEQYSQTPTTSTTDYSTIINRSVPGRNGLLYNISKDTRPKYNSESTQTCKDGYRIPSNYDYQQTVTISKEDLQVIINRINIEPSLRNIGSERPRSASEDKKSFLIEKVQCLDKGEQIQPIDKCKLQLDKTQNANEEPVQLDPSSYTKNESDKCPRKEISFSQLNLTPVVPYYKTPPVLPQVTYEKNMTGHSSFRNPFVPPPSSTLKDKKPTKPKKKNKGNDQKSVLSEVITKRERFQYLSGKRLPINRTARNFAYSENIIESSQKALSRNGSRTLGYVVEGVEPPKILKTSETIPIERFISKKLTRKLDVTVLSVLEIKPTSSQDIDQENENAYQSTTEINELICPVKGATSHVSRQGKSNVTIKRIGSYLQPHTVKLPELTKAGNQYIHKELSNTTCCVPQACNLLITSPTRVSIKSSPTKLVTSFQRQSLSQTASLCAPSEVSTILSTFGKQRSRVRVKRSEDQVLGRRRSITPRSRSRDGQNNSYESPQREGVRSRMKKYSDKLYQKQKNQLAPQYSCNNLPTDRKNNTPAASYKIPWFYHKQRGDKGKYYRLPSSSSSSVASKDSCKTYTSKDNERQQSMFQKNGSQIYSTISSGESPYESDNEIPCYNEPNTLSNEAAPLAKIAEETSSQNSLENKANICLKYNELIQNNVQYVSRKPSNPKVNANTISNIKDISSDVLKSKLPPKIAESNLLYVGRNISTIKINSNTFTHNIKGTTICSDVMKSKPSPKIAESKGKVNANTTSIKDSKDTFICTDVLKSTPFSKMSESERHSTNWENELRQNANKMLRKTFLRAKSFCEDKSNPEAVLQDQDDELANVVVCHPVSCKRPSVAKVTQPPDDFGSVSSRTAFNNESKVTVISTKKSAIKVKSEIFKDVQQKRKFKKLETSSDRNSPTRSNVSSFSPVRIPGRVGQKNIVPKVGSFVEKMKDKTVRKQSVENASTDLSKKEVQRITSLVKFNVIKELQSANLMKTDSEQKSTLEIDELIEKNIASALNQPFYSTIQCNTAVVKNVTVATPPLDCTNNPKGVINSKKSKIATKGNVIERNDSSNRQDVDCKMTCSFKILQSTTVNDEKKGVIMEKRITMIEDEPPNGATFQTDFDKFLGMRAVACKMLPASDNAILQNMITYDQSDQENSQCSAELKEQQIETRNKKKYMEMYSSNTNQTRHPMFSKVRAKSRAKSRDRVSFTQWKTINENALPDLETETVNPAAKSASKIPVKKPVVVVGKFRSKPFKRAQTCVNRAKPISAKSSKISCKVNVNVKGVTENLKPKRMFTNILYSNLMLKQVLSRVTEQNEPQTTNVEQPEQTTSRIPGKGKGSSCLYTKNYRTGKQVSSYETRKRYGESLRRKKVTECEKPTLPTVDKEENYTVYPSNSIIVQYSSPQPSTSKSEMPSTSRDPNVHSSSSRYASEPFGITGGHMAPGVDYKKLGSYLCTKLCCGSSKTSVYNDDEDEFRSSTPKPDPERQYPTIPTIIRPSRSNRNVKEKEKSAEESVKKGEDNIYQTFNFMADYPYVADVFRNKFKAESQISLFNKESLFLGDQAAGSPKSTTSACSILTHENTSSYNTKSNSVVNTNSDDMRSNSCEDIHRLTKQKRLSRIRRRHSRPTHTCTCGASKELLNTIEQNSKNNSSHKNASPKLVSPYEFYHSTPECIHTEIIDDVSSTPTKKKNGRGKVSLLEACQRLKQLPVTLMHDPATQEKNKLNIREHSTATSPSTTSPPSHSPSRFEQTKIERDKEKKKIKNDHFHPEWKSVINSYEKQWDNYQSKINEKKTIVDEHLQLASDIPKNFKMVPWIEETTVDQQVNNKRLKFFRITRSKSCINEENDTIRQKHFPRKPHQIPSNDTNACQKSNVNEVCTDKKEAHYIKRTNKTNVDTQDTQFGDAQNVFSHANEKTKVSKSAKQYSLKMVQSANNDNKPAVENEKNQGNRECPLEKKMYCCERKNANVNISETICVHHERRVKHKSEQNQRKRKNDNKNPDNVSLAKTELYNNRKKPRHELNNSNERKKCRNRYDTCLHDNHNAKEVNAFRNSRKKLRNANLTKTNRSYDSAVNETLLDQNKAMKWYEKVSPTFFKICSEDMLKFSPTTTQDDNGNKSIKNRHKHISKSALMKIKSHSTTEEHTKHKHSIVKSSDIRIGAETHNTKNNDLKMNQEANSSNIPHKKKEDLQRKKKVLRDKDTSEECYKIFAYNNSIELDVEYPLLYTSVLDNFTALGKMGNDDNISKPASPCSVAESGYGSYKSGNPEIQEKNILEKFTSTVCFNQECYDGEQVTLFSPITVFPLHVNENRAKPTNTNSTNSKATNSKNQPTSINMSEHSHPLFNDDISLTQTERNDNSDEIFTAYSYTIVSPKIENEHLDKDKNDEDGATYRANEQVEIKENNSTINLKPPQNKFKELCRSISKQLNTFGKFDEDERKPIRPKKKCYKHDPESVDRTESKSSIREARRKQFTDFKERPLSVLLQTKPDYHKIEHQIQMLDSGRRSKHRSKILNGQVDTDKLNCKITFSRSCKDKSQGKEKVESIVERSKRLLYDPPPKHSKPSCKDLEKDCPKRMSYLKNTDTDVEDMEIQDNDSTDTENKCLKNQDSYEHTARVSRESITSLKDSLDLAFKKLSDDIDEQITPLEDYTPRTCTKLAKRRSHVITKEALRPIKRLIETVFKKFLTAPEDSVCELTQDAIKEQRKTPSKNSLRKLSRDSIISIKDSLDDVFDKISIESAKTSGKLFQKQSRVHSKTIKRLTSTEILTNDSIRPLQELLDIIFEQLLINSDTPDNPPSDNNQEHSDLLTETPSQSSTDTVLEAIENNDESTDNEHEPCSKEKYKKQQNVRIEILEDLPQKETYWFDLSIRELLDKGFQMLVDTTSKTSPDGTPIYSSTPNRINTTNKNMEETFQRLLQHIPEEILNAPAYDFPTQDDAQIYSGPLVVQHNVQQVGLLQNTQISLPESSGIKQYTQQLLTICKNLLNSTSVDKQARELLHQIQKLLRLPVKLTAKELNSQKILDAVKNINKSPQMLTQMIALPLSIEESSNHTSENDNSPSEHDNSTVSNIGFDAIPITPVGLSKEEYENISRVLLEARVVQILKHLGCTQSAFDEIHEIFRSKDMSCENNNNKNTSSEEYRKGSSQHTLPSSDFPIVTQKMGKLEEELPVSFPISKEEFLKLSDIFPPDGFPELLKCLGCLKGCDFVRRKEQPSQHNTKSLNDNTIVSPPQTVDNASKVKEHLQGEITSNDLKEMSSEFESERSVVEQPFKIVINPPQEKRDKSQILKIELETNEFPKEGLLEILKCLGSLQGCEYVRKKGTLSMESFSKESFQESIEVDDYGSSTTSVNKGQSPNGEREQEQELSNQDGLPQIIKSHPEEHREPPIKTKEQVPNQKREQKESKKFSNQFPQDGLPQIMKCTKATCTLRKSQSKEHKEPRIEAKHSPKELTDSLESVIAILPKQKEVKTESSSKLNQASVISTDEIKIISNEFPVERLLEILKRLGCLQGCEYVRKKAKLSMESESYPEPIEIDDCAKTSVNKEQFPNGNRKQEPKKLSNPFPQDGLPQIIKSAKGPGKLVQSQPDEHKEPPIKTREQSPNEKRQNEGQNNVSIPFPQDRLPQNIKCAKGVCRLRKSQPIEYKEPPFKTRDQSPNEKRQQEGPKKLSNPFPQEGLPQNIKCTKATCTQIKPQPKELKEPLIDTKQQSKELSDASESDIAILPKQTVFKESQKGVQTEPSSKLTHTSVTSTDELKPTSNEFSIENLPEILKCLGCLQRYEQVRKKDKLSLQSVSKETFQKPLQEPIEIDDYLSPTTSFNKEQSPNEEREQEESKKLSNQLSQNGLPQIIKYATGPSKQKKSQPNKLDSANSTLNSSKDLETVSTETSPNVSSKTVEPINEKKKANSLSKEEYRKLSQAYSLFSQDSWAHILEYLGCSESTCQMKETTDKLPSETPPQSAGSTNGHSKYDFTTILQCLECPHSACKLKDRARENVVEHPTQSINAGIKEAAEELTHTLKSFSKTSEEDREKLQDIFSQDKMDEIKECLGSPKYIYALQVKQNATQHDEKPVVITPPSRELMESFHKIHSYTPRKVGASPQSNGMSEDDEGIIQELEVDNIENLDTNEKVCECVKLPCLRNRGKLGNKITNPNEELASTHYNVEEVIRPKTISQEEYDKLANVFSESALLDIMECLGCANSKCVMSKRDDSRNQAMEKRKAQDLYTSETIYSSAIDMSEVELCDTSTNSMPGDAYKTHDEQHISIYEPCEELVKMIGKILSSQDADEKNFARAAKREYNQPRFISSQSFEKIQELLEAFIQLLNAYKESALPNSDSSELPTKNLSNVTKGSGKLLGGSKEINSYTQPSYRLVNDKCKTPHSGKSNNQCKNAANLASDLLEEFKKMSSLPQPVTNKEVCNASHVASNTQNNIKTLSKELLLELNLSLLPLVKKESQQHVNQSHLRHSDNARKNLETLSEKLLVELTKTLDEPQRSTKEISKESSFSVNNLTLFSKQFLKSLSPSLLSVVINESKDTNIATNSKELVEELNQSLQYVRAGEESQKQVINSSSNNVTNISKELFDSSTKSLSPSLLSMVENEHLQSIEDLNESSQNTRNNIEHLSRKLLASLSKPFTNEASHIPIRNQLHHTPTTSKKLPNNASKKIGSAKLPLVKKGIQRPITDSFQQTASDVRRSEEPRASAKSAHKRDSKKLGAKGFAGIEEAIQHSLANEEPRHIHCETSMDYGEHPRSSSKKSKSRRAVMIEEGTQRSIKEDIEQLALFDNTHKDVNSLKNKNRMSIGVNSKVPPSDTTNNLSKRGIINSLANEQFPESNDCSTFSCTSDLPGSSKQTLSHSSCTWENVSETSTNRLKELLEILQNVNLQYSTVQAEEPAHSPAPALEQFQNTYVFNSKLFLSNDMDRDHSNKENSKQVPKKRAKIIPNEKIEVTLSNVSGPSQKIQPKFSEKLKDQNSILPFGTCKRKDKVSNFLSKRSKTVGCTTDTCESGIKKADKFSQASEYVKFPVQNRDQSTTIPVKRRRLSNSPKISPKCSEHENVKEPFYLKDICPCSKDNKLSKEQFKQLSPPKQRTLADDTKFQTVTDTDPEQCNLPSCWELSNEQKSLLNKLIKLSKDKDHNKNLTKNLKNLSTDSKGLLTVIYKYMFKDKPGVTATSSQNITDEIETILKSPADEQNGGNMSQESLEYLVDTLIHMVSHAKNTDVPPRYEKDASTPSNVLLDTNEEREVANKIVISQESLHTKKWSKIMNIEDTSTQIKDSKHEIVNSSHSTKPADETTETQPKPSKIYAGNASRSTQSNVSNVSQKTIITLKSPNSRAQMDQNKSLSGKVDSKQQTDNQENFESSSRNFKDLSNITLAGSLNSTNFPLTNITSSRTSLLESIRERVSAVLSNDSLIHNSAADEITDELLKSMCNASLKAIIELYRKLSDNDNIVSFKMLIEELCKNKEKQTGSFMTHSQLKVLGLLENCKKQKESSDSDIIPPSPKPKCTNISKCKHMDDSCNCADFGASLNTKCCPVDKDTIKKSTKILVPIPIVTNDQLAQQPTWQTPRGSLTDKELFEKLLESYEKEEKMVEKLSNDDLFFQSQLDTVKSKESVENLLQEPEENEKPLKSRKLSDVQTEDSASRKLSFAEQKELNDKTKPTSLKSRVQKLFTKQDRGKEMLAPRDDELKKFSVTQPFQPKTDSPEEIIKSVPLDNNVEDNSKVKFGKKSRAPAENQNDEPEIEITKPAERNDKRETDSMKLEELGTCFLRGFRPDYVSLKGDTCLWIGKKEKLKQKNKEETFIHFSERDSPLEYLLALGFSIEEASTAIKDEDVKNRLLAAITEARIWINKISTVQGTLLYLISYKIKPKTMRYFLQLVEAIINKRINDAVKLDAFLRLLEKVEDGNLAMISIVGSGKVDDDENEEMMVKKQLKQLFTDVFNIAESEARKRQRHLSKSAIVLLRILSAKYRAGLHPHLELIAKYIGQGLITNEVQLEAAMIYLSRTDTADVNLKEFENYCAIECNLEQSFENIETL